MLPCVVNNLRPGIANATWKLSKMMHIANKAAFLRMNQVINYVLDTKHLGFKIVPKGNKMGKLNIICFNSNNDTGDLAMRRSINGFMLYVLDVLVS